MPALIGCVVCVKDELAALKLRFEKAEAEKVRLKDENEKLEIRVRIPIALLSRVQLPPFATRHG